MAPTFVSLFIGFIQFVSTFIGCFYLLHNYGRRSLMLIGNFMMAITIGLVGYCLIYSYERISVIATLLFIFFFSISAGPVTWAYLGEIMKPNSMGIAVFAMWVLNIAASYIFPEIVKLTESNP